MRTDLKQVAEAVVGYTAKGKKPNVHILYVNSKAMKTSYYLTEAYKMADKKGVNGYSLLDITRGALVNGVNHDGKDISLLPMFNGKMLLLPNMSFLLESRRADVRSILRFAFDGQVSMCFANGVQRTYDTNFNFLGVISEYNYHKLCMLDSSLVDRLLIFIDGFLMEKSNIRWIKKNSSFLGMLQWNKPLTQKIYKRYYQQ